TGFEVANTGKEQALDPAKMFNRIYRSADQPSPTSLGLAVVSAIAQLQQADNEYRYEDNLHGLHYRLPSRSYSSSDESRGGFVASMSGESIGIPTGVLRRGRPIK